MRLFINIDYDIKSNVFCFETDIKENKLQDTILNFLRCQIGKGEDSSVAEKHTLYRIDMVLDLTTDTFYVTHNCGNVGLREGILMLFCQRLEK